MSQTQIFWLWLERCYYFRLWLGGDINPTQIIISNRELTCYLRDGNLNITGWLGLRSLNIVRTFPESHPFSWLYGISHQLDPSTEQAGRPLVTSVSHLTKSHHQKDWDWGSALHVRGSFWPVLLRQSRYHQTVSIRWTIIMGLTCLVRCPIKVGRAMSAAWNN